MQFPLDLNATNVSSLIKGRPIQLKGGQLNGSKHFLVVHPTTHRRMSIAKSKGKGLRIQLTPEEVKASGEGFMDILRSFKKGAEWLKTHVIDSNIYQTAVKPVVRQLVDTGVAAATPFLGPAAPLAKQAVEKIGETTGAYGLVIPTKKGRKTKAVAVMSDAAAIGQNPMPVMVAVKKPRGKAKAGSIYIQ